MYRDIDSGVPLDDRLHRIHLQLADVQQAESLVGDVVGFDLVVVPQMDLTDAELGQAKRDPGARCADTDDVDAALPPLVGIEELPMT